MAGGGSGDSRHTHTVHSRQDSLPNGDLRNSSPAPCCHSQPSPQPGPGLPPRQWPEDTGALSAPVLAFEQDPQKTRTMSQRSASEQGCQASDLNQQAGKHNPGEAESMRPQEKKTSRTVSHHRGKTRHHVARTGCSLPKGNPVET